MSMRLLPKILLLLSAPAGLIGYSIGAQLVTMLMPGLADSIVMLFIPLLVAGLCMVPFLIPFFDQKAKADLAAHRAQQAAAGEADGNKPGDKPRSAGGRG
jgi:hypothetical protein